MEATVATVSPPTRFCTIPSRCWPCRRSTALSASQCSRTEGIRPPPSQLPCARTRPGKRYAGMLSSSEKASKLPILALHLLPRPSLYQNLATTTMHLHPLRNYSHPPQVTTPFLSYPHHPSRPTTTARLVLVGGNCSAATHVPVFFIFAASRRLSIRQIPLPRHLFLPVVGLFLHFGNASDVYGRGRCVVVDGARRTKGQKRGLLEALQIHGQTSERAKNVTDSMKDTGVKIVNSS
ncbi:hypothetical protein BC830DRAFT_581449 [Chytriomyces sp. MP71]|nr:hypothetical protein BC830DRAFT_581449 [Chytriomyces sp. MP71]